MFNFNKYSSGLIDKYQDRQKRKSAKCKAEKEFPPLRSEENQPGFRLPPSNIQCWKTK